MTGSPEELSALLQRKPRGIRLDQGAEQLELRLPLRSLRSRRPPPYSGADEEPWSPRALSLVLLAGCAALAVSWGPGPGRTTLLASLFPLALVFYAVFRERMGEAPLIFSEEHLEVRGCRLPWKELRGCSLAGGDQTGSVELATARGPVRFGRNQWAGELAWLKELVLHHLARQGLLEQATDTIEQLPPGLREVRAPDTH